MKSMNVPIFEKSEFSFALSNYDPPKKKEVED